jgi:hypothetical protein
MNVAPGCFVYGGVRWANGDDSSALNHKGCASQGRPPGAINEGSSGENGWRLSVRRASDEKGDDAQEKIDYEAAIHGLRQRNRAARSVKIG